MNKISILRHLLRRNLLVMVGGFLCFYFTFHAVQGQRSFARLAQVQADILKLEQDFALLSRERLAIESRVVMLRPGSVNRDLLEERVRYVLGYRHPDEVALVASAAF